MMNLFFYKRLLFAAILITLSCLLISCSNPSGIEDQETNSGIYYISQTGNDDNSVTSVDSPWKSLKKLESINFQPGDSILFEKNSEFSGGIIFNSSGTSDNPILLGSYGQGSIPSFTNTNYTLQNGNVFQIRGSHIVIDGLSFKNCANSTSSVDNEILLVGAIYAKTGANFLTIQNCEFNNCPIGIYINSQYCLVTKNYLHDCNRFLSEPDWGPIGIIIGNVYNEISYNTCSNYIKVGGNYGADGGFLEFDDRYFGNQVHDVKVHHNKSFNNMGFLEVERQVNANNLDVYYNLSNDYQQFIFYWGGNNSKVENNTIIRTKPSINGAVNTIFTMTNGNFTLRNNIFVVANRLQVLRTAPYGVGNYNNVTHENNLYYCTDGSISNPCGKQLGNGEIIADPKFINLSIEDYHLSFESPAINSGLTLGYSLDLDNNHVPADDAPDIGAYERQ